MFLIAPCSGVWQAGTHQSRAITVEYSLTNLGRTIIAPLRGMCRWAKRHRKKVTADVTLSNT
jgi:DNA-binding HxlR family transcriptional regulator